MKLTSITKRYDDNTVFDNFNLTIQDNKITCILGKSGCGKTTLLNIIAHLTDYQGKTDVENEKISYIFQNQRLLNNLTVAGNLRYVLKNCNFSSNEIEEKINDILKLVKLKENKHMYPKQLSGGMAQRVSLARAFVYPSKILLMDEPFKGLDISLKKHIIKIFQDLFNNDKKTTIFVTHDIEEALLLADRIIVLGDGGIILLDKELESRDDALISNLRRNIYKIM
ncbi:MAG: ABC transporter ATP-binding protein [Clostridiales bacterium]|nr:ABC transporter ATP-binding protein [Clostridiales bacterium]